MLTPTANFAVDPDPRRAVRFGSTLFATKSSYTQTNVANPVQAAPSEFHLSLNNSDILEDETKTLEDYGVVGGDLVYVIVENSADTDSSASSSSISQQDSLEVQLSRGQESTKDTQSQPNEICVTSNSDEKMDNNSESADSGAQFTETSSELLDCDPVDITVVNQCLREPVLCRDASETMVPSLLREVYESANPTDSMEALSVLLHVLMLETGYVSCVQQPPASTESVANLLPVSAESVVNLPATWRQPGCCRFEYNYPACQDVSCSITVMSAGTSLIVHGKVTGDHAVTRQCTLKQNEFIRETSTDATSCYCNMKKLSMVFKDNVANPLISDMRIVAGIEDVYGLLALNQEVKLQILSYLDVRSLLRASCVNSELYNLSRDIYLWRRLYLRDFGNRRDNSLSQDWRKLYIQEHKNRKERRKLMSRMTMITPPTWHPPNPFAGPSHWIPPGPGMIGGDYDLFPNFPSGLPGIPNRFGPRHPQMPRPRYDLIGPNPDHEIDINPGMGPLRPPGRGGGRMNPFGGFGP